MKRTALATTQTRRSDGDRIKIERRDKNRRKDNRDRFHVRHG